MKIFSGILVVSLLGGAGILRAAGQPPSGQTVQIPVPTPLAVSHKDANSSAWERTVYETGPKGQIMPHKHSYTELATGLHYWSNGQWLDSKEEIDILPNGTAAATNGQHQAYFPGDIFQGQIELVTSDGKHLKSRPLGLSYFDGQNSVLFAELTNSIGIVVGNNQVIYPDAFTDFKADLRYTYTKAGFEQDIILRQQPPTPQSLRLNPDSTRLQVLTEFFSPPQPSIKSRPMAPQAGLTLTDQTLGFGTMQMIPGRAFMLGNNAKDAGARVSKSWQLLDGRQFLVEEVPVDAIVEGLAALPLTALNSRPGQPAHTAARHLPLPPQRLAKNDTVKLILLARSEPSAPGYVLDYQTLNGSVTNYTFHGDATYYISGSLALNGTNTLEGGTVIKYNSSGSINIDDSTTVLNCLTAPYRPAIFTSMNDNSVGETISGSDGNPADNGALGILMSGANLPLILHDIRMLYFGIGIWIGDGTNNVITDAQFIGCDEAMRLSWGDCKFLNALIYGGSYAFDGSQTVWCQNVTFDGISNLQNDDDASLYLTNCLVVAVGNTNYIAGGANNQFLSSATGVFQTVGGGNYYLATNCPAGIRGAGTTNIDPALLADLQRKTTWPPVIYSNVTVSVNTTLSPQAARDTNATPDLGYHYDPIDYLVDLFAVTNATLTISSGTVIAADNTVAGIWLQDGSAINSTGTATSPNWFVHYSCVQEEPVSFGSSAYLSIIINPYHSNPTNPNGIFQFNKFATLAAGCGYYFYNNSSWAYNNLLVQNCELWNSGNDFSGAASVVAAMENNLFARSSIYAFGSATNYSLSLSNNLCLGTSVSISPNGNSNQWFFFNNDFDTCTITMPTSHGRSQNAVNGYNAYLNCSNRLTPTNAFDLVSTNSLNYQTGPLGTFYQPTNSALINAGCTNANLVGLYHFTTQTSQIKETNSIVDIGYHYVAVDANGLPFDSNGNGIPDYLDDANGNGQIDSGEIGWNIFGDLGLNVFITRPRNGSLLP